MWFRDWIGSPHRKECSVRTVVLTHEGVTCTALDEWAIYVAGWR